MQVMDWSAQLSTPNDGVEPPDTGASGAPDGSGCRGSSVKDGSTLIRVAQGWGCLPPAEGPDALAGGPRR